MCCKPNNIPLEGEPKTFLFQRKTIPTPDTSFDFGNHEWTTHKQLVKIMNSSIFISIWVWFYPCYNLSSFPSSSPSSAPPEDALVAKPTRKDLPATCPRRSATSPRCQETSNRRTEGSVGVGIQRSFELFWGLEGSSFKCSFPLSFMYFLRRTPIYWKQTS